MESALMWHDWCRERDDPRPASAGVEGPSKTFFVITVAWAQMDTNGTDTIF